MFKDKLFVVSKMIKAKTHENGDIHWIVIDVYRDDENDREIIWKIKNEKKE